MDILDDVAKSLILNLKQYGVEPIKFSKTYEGMNPLIWVTEEIHIQVGLDEVYVVKSIGNSQYEFYKTDSSMKDIFQVLSSII